MHRRRRRNALFTPGHRPPLGAWAWGMSASRPFPMPYSMPSFRSCSLTP
ncbi:hypothetical protein GQ607_000792 [Colletotrichum asianum]|uniref:Uncharacterized protein n=1 Tax=Colletotrichum asianum TaxID=702518 RepID=A0A8H3ZX61_9PEZI|nr:hypothetical protein GQ607_000792 [Colletotrichum asianum]